MNLNNVSITVVSTVIMVNYCFMMIKKLLYATHTLISIEFLDSNAHPQREHVFTRETSYIFTFLFQSTHSTFPYFNYIWYHVAMRLALPAATKILAASVGSATIYGKIILHGINMFHEINHQISRVYS